MKGCHSCETAAAIAEGKYAGRAWKDTPCAGCDVMSGSGFAIEFDEGRLGKAEGHNHEGREAQHSQGTRGHGAPVRQAPWPRCGKKDAWQN